MKAVVILMLGGALVLTSSSCATVPKEPLGPGEVRLTRMDIPDNGTLSANVGYLFTIHFQAEDNPPIKRVCFAFSSGRKYCDSIESGQVLYGPKAEIRAPLHIPAGGPNRLDCCLEYVRNGEIQRTNILSAYVIGFEEH